MQPDRKLEPARRSVDRDRFDMDTGRALGHGTDPDEPSPDERLTAAQDWDGLKDAAPSGSTEPEDGLAGEGVEIGGDLPEEDDDNPDQESDEALPDDDEEHAIRRDMGGEGVRYEPE